MGHVEIDAPHVLIARMDHPHRLRRLDEEDRLEATEVHEGGNAPRHAARTRRIGDLSGQHFLVVLFHPFLHPGLEVWIGEIGDPIGRLPAGVIGNEGMGRVLLHERRPAGNRYQVAGPDPPSLVGGKIGHRRVLLRRRPGGQRRADESGQDAAGEKPCS
jgi:hypothetical protein